MTRLLASSVMAVLVWPIASQGADKPTVEQMQKAIEELGDKRFSIREKASKLLWEAGTESEQLLRVAATSDNAERAARAKALLDKFDWGIFPDTRPEILELIGQFRGGDRNVRLQVVGRLMAFGKPGYSTLKRLANMEPDPASKQAIFVQIAQDAQKALPGLLAVGDFAAAEELLERSLLAGTEDGFTNFAAYQLLAARIPQAIERWTAEWQRTRSATAGTALVHLHRCRNEFDRARNLAVEMKNDALLEQVLWEEANWKELAPYLKRADADVKEASSIGMRAMVHRFAGDDRSADAMLERLRKLGESADRYEAKSSAEALLINGRLNDAMTILQSKPIAPALTFDLLFNRLQVREALAYADQTKVDDKEDRFHLQLRRARALYYLGRRDDAFKAFDSLGAQLKEAGDTALARELGECMSRIFLVERADAIVGRYLAELQKLNVMDGWDEVLEPLFGDDAPAAITWFRFLHAKRVDEPGNTLAIVRNVLSNRPEARRDAWAAELAKSPPGPEVKNGIEGQEGPAHPALAAGIAMLRSGHDVRAVGFFETALLNRPSAATAMRMGDHYWGLGRFKDAADWYGRAAKIEPGNPLATFLSGAATKRSGNEAEGRRLIELAHRMPMGSEFDRGRLAGELERRGFVEDANRERELVLTFGWYRSANFGNVLDHAARRSIREEKYDAAIRMYRQVLAGALRSSASYLDLRAYLTAPFAADLVRIRAALKEKRYDDALASARQCLNAVPDDINLVIDVVPQLDRANRRADADRLFDEVMNRFKTLAREFPDSGFAHNSIAWLATNCRRDLDAALRHAEKAVQLEPRAASYLDTLAETHFQRGDHEKAMELMRQCRAKDPTRAYYTKQLVRFQKADRSAPVPAEIDD